MKKYFLPVTVVLSLLFVSCNNDDKKKETEMKEPKLKEENVTYSPAGIKDSLVLDGYVAYDENIEGKRPAVLVVHEWWGLNDYVKMRVRELAKLGYIAMALDMYGNGKRADNPTDAGNLAGPFYQNPQMAKERFDAALVKLKSYSQADASKVAAIGYCFGGTQVLNMANLGEDLVAVVSFHGGLKVVIPMVRLTHLCHRQKLIFSESKWTLSGRNTHLKPTRGPPMPLVILMQLPTGKSLISRLPIMPLLTLPPGRT